MFWDEFRAFQRELPPFDKKARWNTANALAGESHLWHEKYSVPHTAVVGYSGCRSTSKGGGIGGAESSWGDVKHIKMDKWASIGGNSVGVEADLYTTATAHIHDGRIKRGTMEKMTGWPRCNVWGR